MRQNDPYPPKSVGFGVHPEKVNAHSRRKIHCALDSHPDGRRTTEGRSTFDGRREKSAKNARRRRG